MLAVALILMIPVFPLILFSLPLSVMEGRDKGARIVATLAVIYPIIALISYTLPLLSSHLAKYGMLWMYASVYIYILSALIWLCIRHDMIMKKQLLEPHR